MTTRQQLGAQLLDVLDVAAEPLVVVGRDWTYLYVNDAARDLLALHDGAVGTDVRAAHPHVVGTPLAAAAGRVMDGGPAEVVDQHDRVLGVDLRVRVTPVADGIALALRELTGTSRPPNRLMRDADLCQQLLDHATPAITLVDLDDRFVLLNRAAAEMIGRPVEDLVARSMTDVFGDEVGQRMGALHAEARRAGHAVEITGIDSWQRARGRDVLVEVFPVYGAASELLGSGAVVTDVTRLIATERELVASEARYRAVFAGSSLSLLVVRPAGAVVEANAAACRLLGYSRAELLAMRADDLVRADPEAIARRRTRMLTEGRLGYEEEDELVRSDGRVVPVLLTVKLVDEPGGGQVAFLVIRDQSRLQQLQAQLVRSERMEAAARLAAAVAHDANNVLAAVQGYAQLLSLEVDDPSAQRHVAGIQRSVDRAADMVSQLLAFTRGQDLEATDVAQVVAEQQDMLRRLLPQEISLLLELEPAPARADASQVGRVLLNLVVNARDAVGGSGTICVRTCTEVLEADDVLGAGSYAVLSVTDDGRGMDAAVAARCFEPYFTTRTTGTGLGLSSAHGIARQSGGDLRVRSSPGEGAELRLLLPSRMDTQPAPDDGDQPAGPLVLVVDDDISARHFVRALLQGGGCRVLEAGDGQEAVAVATAAGPVDLLLADLQMPHLDGAALAELLRETRPGLPVLLMSAAGPARDRSAASVLQKPFTGHELLTAVADALARRSG
jgi:PAS domain S-box-containing protein